MPKRLTIEQKYNEAIYMYFIKNMSIDEISSTVKLSTRTVTKRIKLGLFKLTNIFKTQELIFT